MSSENDDDWAELARELAREKPPQPVTEQALAEESGFGEGFASTQADAHTSSDSTEGGVDAILDGADAPPAEDLPGTGRKRRRRRRRRRRGGTEQTAEAGAAETDEAEGDEMGETVEAEYSEAESESSEVGFSDEAEEEHDTQLVASETDADEDAGGELLRDLIATWNVPSWDDVVAGLYRPER